MVYFLDDEQTVNPLSALQPAFVFSFVAQIILLTIVLTLVAVLLGLLLFTFRYHYPMAKVNCVVQLIAVAILLVSVVTSISIAVSEAKETSSTWPFTFDYIEVLIPNSDWSTGDRAAWLLLQGVVALAVHATHIQFLTLLFPSQLEVRLICGILGETICL